MGLSGIREIVVSAVMMRDEQGRVLNVRKRGTHMMMLPGGKPEVGENPATTALREFQEELGVALDPTLLDFTGEFRTAAANEPGYALVAYVFEHPLVAGLTAHAEIELLEWIDPSSEATTARTDIAPLNAEHIFPSIVSGHPQPHDPA